MSLCTRTPPTTGKQRRRSQMKRVMSMTRTRGDANRSAASTAGSGARPRAAATRTPRPAGACASPARAGRSRACAWCCRVVADHDHALDRRRQRLPGGDVALDLRLERRRARPDDHAAAAMLGHEQRAHLGMDLEPALHLGVPARAGLAVRALERGRRVREQALALIHRDPAPALRARDDLERGSPVDGVAVAHEREARLRAGGREPERAGRGAGPGRDRRARGARRERRVAGRRRHGVAQPWVAARCSGSRAAAPKQRGAAPARPWRRADPLATRPAPRGGRRGGARAGSGVLLVGVDDALAAATAGHASIDLGRDRVPALTAGVAEHAW